MRGYCTCSVQYADKHDLAGRGKRHSRCVPSMRVQYTHMHTYTPFPIILDDSHAHI